MFGDMDSEDTDITKLETEATKDLCQQAAQAEEESTISAHSPIPKDKVTQVLITSILIPNEFRILAKSLLEIENVKEKSARNPTKKITQFFYTCCVWPLCSEQAIYDDTQPQMSQH